MRRDRIRQWWPLGSVIVIAVAVVWLLYVLWRARAQPGLPAYWAVPVSAVPLVGALFVWAWRQGRPSAMPLHEAADELASAVQAQWQRAAGERGLTGADPIPVSWGRPAAAVAGAVPAAAGSATFKPLPGLEPAGEADVTSGRAGDLHALYGGLGSGRLVVTGPPGSGKTGAAVLLVLAALRHREDVPAAERGKVPVPVLLTAQDWNPDTEPVAAWLVRKLRGTYPLFGGAAGAKTAAGLVAAGRISVILDGLDEIRRDLRPVALQALSDQATFRLVALSRTSEMTAAAGRGGVLRGSAAIQLNPVGADEAAGYLERTQLDPPPARWRELAERIRADPDGPLATALDNPLALTLVRDTCQDEKDIGKLLDFCGAQDTKSGGNSEKAKAITGYLLGRLLPAAYTRRPGQPPPPYDLETAQRTLARIAARMNSDGTRDLNWWQIPAWVPRTPHIMVSFIAGALATGLVAGVAAGVAFGSTPGILATFSSAIRLPAEITTGPVTRFFSGLGAVLGGELEIGLAAGLAAGAASRARLVGSGAKALIKGILAAGLAAGAAAGFLSGLASGILFGSAAGLSDGLFEMLLFGLVTAGIAAGLATRPRLARQGESLPHARADLRLAKAFTWQNLAAGLATGLAAGFEYGSISTLKVGILAGAGLGFAVTFLLGIRSSLIARPDRFISLDPVASRRRNRGYGLSVGLAAGLAVAASSGLTCGLAAGPAFGLAAGVVEGLGIGVTVGLLNIKGFPVSLAEAWLAIRWRTPWRLMRFLEDARRRNILRTVGPAYQFRHARLQDRLAAAPAPGLPASARGSRQSLPLRHGNAGVRDG